MRTIIDLWSRKNVDKSEKSYTSSGLHLPLNALSLSLCCLSIVSDSLHKQRDGNVGRWADICLSLILLIMKDGCLLGRMSRLSVVSGRTVPVSKEQGVGRE